VGELGLQISPHNDGNWADAVTLVGNAIQGHWLSAMPNQVAQRKHGSLVIFVEVGCARAVAMISSSSCGG